MNRSSLVSIDASGFAALGLIALATWLVAVSPALRTRTERESAAEAHREVERELAEGRVERRRAERELEAARGALSAEAVALQGVGALNQRVQDVTALASDSGLELDAIAPGEAARGEMFDVSPIEIRGRGSYAGLASFLHRANSELPDIGLSEVSVRAEGEGGASFSVRLIWYAAPDGPVGEESASG